MRRGASRKRSRPEMEKFRSMGTGTCLLQALVLVLVLSSGIDVCQASFCIRDIPIRGRSVASGWRTRQMRRYRPKTNVSHSLSRWMRRSEEDTESLGIQPRSIPKHVAFVCDGNSRWAEARSLPALTGYTAGAERLVACLDGLKRQGVQFCTMYGFSTENWRRSPDEIRDILSVMEHTANTFRSRAIEENLRVKILGDLQDERIPSSLRESLERLERDTAEAASIVQRDRMSGDRSELRHERFTLCIAINYGGRQDILNASKKLAAMIASGEVNSDRVSEADLVECLYTAGIPDPDLIVRTGGEQRLSNFLLWNAAYTELYFTESLWPDFDEASLDEALNWYATRSRRFGGRTEKLAKLDRATIRP